MLLRYNALKISSFKNLILERNCVVHKIKITNFVPHISVFLLLYTKIHVRTTWCSYQRRGTSGLPAVHHTLRSVSPRRGLLWNDPTQYGGCTAEVTVAPDVWMALPGLMQQDFLWDSTLFSPQVLHLHQWKTSDQIIKPWNFSRGMIQINEWMLFSSNS